MILPPLGTIIFLDRFGGRSPERCRLADCALCLINVFKANGPGLTDDRSEHRFRQGTIRCPGSNSVRKTNYSNGKCQEPVGICGRLRSDFKSPRPMRISGISHPLVRDMFHLHGSLPGVGTGRISRLLENRGPQQAHLTWRKRPRKFTVSQ